MTTQKTTWRGWRRHFSAQARRPLPPLPARIDVPEDLRAPLARSLARFQVGEGGEGRIAHQIYRTRLATIDDDYRAALRLFVREEGRHARILAQMVRGLDGALVKSTWSERLFVGVRRLAGVRLKLLVLLAAEVVGIGFYGHLARRLPAGELREALAEITADESAHLDFHVDFFRRETAGSRARKALFAGLWIAIAGAACLLVVVDHRATLRRSGGGSWAAMRDYGRRIAAVLRATLDAPETADAAAESIVGRPAPRMSAAS
ncbi:MAG: ferritin-like domain-containing protein [Myxococcales bacterium]|nr:ferritin-like domain-containing protein [Myxococcales bacterium]